MRLLNTTTLLLKEFIGKAPPYAILSHTWGDGEVLFQDFREDPTAKAAWAKVKSSCDVARELGHEWIWIDTCCIDKSSSAELSEAINSMFRWYEKAVVCLAYLSDIQLPDPETDAFAEVLAGSRWFTRGWTLQELLAPRHLDFYSSDWKLLGPRARFADAVSRKTGIEIEFLSARAGVRKRLAGVSVAARMCWASGRKTTRIEDMAYCLLGIFDINMPLIYGEGHKAFKRLQEIIIREIDDQSIFAWGRRSNSQPSLDLNSWGSPLLAGHPSWFKNSGDIIPFSPRDVTAPLYVEVNGITLSTPLGKSRPTLSSPQHLPRGTKLNNVGGASDMPVRFEAWPEEKVKRGPILVAPLKCRRKGDFFNCIAITLCTAYEQHSSNEDAPSCHRVSHMTYSAPRSTWTEENICRPFIYFQSDYERSSSIPEPEAGCVIRSTPHEYRPGKCYYLSGKYCPMNSIIGCHFDLTLNHHPTVVPLEGPVRNLTLVLQGVQKKGELSNRFLSAKIFIGPENATLRQISQMVPGGYLFHGFAETDDVQPALVRTSKPEASSSGAQYQLQPFTEFIIRISREPAYGPFIFIIDIEHPFGRNVTRETNQLGSFTPVRRDSINESWSDRPPSNFTEILRTPSVDLPTGDHSEFSPSPSDTEVDFWEDRRPKTYSRRGSSSLADSPSTATRTEYDGSDADE